MSRTCRWMLITAGLVACPRPLAGTTAELSQQEVLHEGHLDARAIGFSEGDYMYALFCVHGDSVVSFGCSDEAATYFVAAHLGTRLRITYEFVRQSNATSRDTEEFSRLKCVQLDRLDSKTWWRNVTSIMGLDQAEASFSQLVDSLVRNEPAAAAGAARWAEVTHDRGARDAAAEHEVVRRTQTGGRMCRGAVISEPGWNVCVALWLTAFVVGCASTRQVPAQGAFDSAADSTRLRNGIEIAGYVTSDGDYHSFHGTARLLDQSWHFVSLPVWGEPREEVTLPLDAVRSLEVEKGTYDNPMALAAGITIVAAAALGVWFTYAISRWHD